MRKFFVSALAITLAYTLFVDDGLARKKAPKEIRLGCLVSATGMFAGFGQGNLFGAKAAVDRMLEIG